MLWKFGSFDLDASGQGTLDRTETYVLHTIEMNLPKSETWFIKFDLHPENKVYSYLTIISSYLYFSFWHVETRLVSSICGN